MHAAISAHHTIERWDQSRTAKVNVTLHTLCECDRRNANGKRSNVTTMCDRRLACAFLILATGISAVVLVEKLQSYSLAPLTAYARWFVATPSAQSRMVVTSIATGRALAAAHRFAAPVADRRWLLPDSEICR